jgi:hypothetical protein
VDHVSADGSGVPRVDLARTALAGCALGVSGHAAGVRDAQLVFLLDLYQVAPWQAFMRWFAVSADVTAPAGPGRFEDARMA